MIEEQHKSVSGECSADVLAPSVFYIERIGVGKADHVLKYTTVCSKIWVICKLCVEVNIGVLRAQILHQLGCAGECIRDAFAFANCTSGYPDASNNQTNHTKYNGCFNQVEPRISGSILMSIHEFVRAG